MKNLIEKELNEFVEFNEPYGGLSFYLKIKDESISSKVLFSKLKEKNVFITPGAVFYLGSSVGDRYFRIGFSQTKDQKIIDGIKIIKEELEKWHM